MSVPSDNNQIQIRERQCGEGSTRDYQRGGRLWLSLVDTKAIAIIHSCIGNGGPMIKCDA